MKKVLLSFLLLAAVPAGARTHYCDVTLYRTSLSGTAVTISIETGDNKQLYAYIRRQDSSFVHKVFRTPVDVINFMARMGWELRAALPAKNQNETHFYFSREFDDDRML